MLVTSPFVCRDYVGSDAYKILHLFNTVFGKKRSPQFWRWEFMDNPSGRAIIKLMFDRNELIGHYAILPMLVQVGDIPTKACLSVDTMVHPEYRHRGIFSSLANETYEMATRKGFKFVYGFPNNNSHHGFSRRLKWTSFGNMDIWQRTITVEDTLTPVATDHIKPIRQFQDDINSLWESVKQDYLVTLLRTKEFLNWRFTLTPEVSYPKFAFFEYNKLLGYTVLKLYQMNTERKGHIVDILAVNDRVILTALLKHSCRYFLNQGVNNISCWCSEGSLLNVVLDEDGFSKAKMDKTYFGIRILDAPDKSLGPVSYFPSWHLSMGHSDVF